jgi:hypothetical protein
MGLSLINMLGLSSSVHFAHTACYWKFFLLHYIQVLCQYRLCRAYHAYLTYLMLQRQLVTGTVVSLTTAKFKPLIFPMSGFTANMFILMILYDFCFLHTEGWKLCANRGPVCTLENFQWRAAILRTILNYSNFLILVQPRHGPRKKT